MLPFLEVLQGFRSRLNATSSLLGEDAHDKLALRFAAVERALLLVQRARTTILRAPTASLLGVRSRDAVRQLQTTTARSNTVGAPDFSDPLPAIVVKAQEDVRTRRTLERIGYRAVRAAHARQLRVNRSNIFYGLSRDELWPTMELVANWLSAERRRLLASATRTFLGTMVITIVTGLGFLAGVAIFK